MTKLLIVSEQLWPEGGGGTLATYLIVNLLAQSGIDVSVVTGTRNPSKVKGVNYIFNPHLRFSNKLRLWGFLAQPLAENWFKGVIKRTDVIYVPRYCYPLIPLAKKLGKKVVVHLHDHQLISYNATVLHNSCGRGMFENARDIVKFELLEHNSTIRALLSTLFTPVNRLSRLWISEVDEIICVSHKQREIIGRAAPELGDKLKVLYNPLPDVPMIKKGLRDQTFMYLGGDSYVKGFHIFLKASQELLERGFNAEFCIAGGFKHINRLLIERLNKKFEGAYNLLGYISHEEVLKLHSMSYALLLPSISEEPLPYAVLEAMLAGTIPIASEVGGVPEIVEGSFAEKMLFKPYNVNELADRMESLLSMSNEQIIDVGFGLRETTLKRFNPEATKKKLIEVFLSKCCGA